MKVTSYIFLAAGIVFLSVNCFGREVVVPDDYATIQEAIDSAEAGDTVEVKAGVYEERLILKEGVEVRGVSAEECIVQCDAKLGIVVTATECKDGTISDLTLRQQRAWKVEKGKNTLFPVVQINSSSIKVVRCKICEGGDNGITIEGKGESEVSECEIIGNRRSGIYVSGDAEPVLRNNSCSENKINGIYFKDGSSGVVKENVCAKNGANGISAIHNWTFPKVLDNRCSENGGSGIWFGEGAKGDVESNVCEKNVWHGITIADDKSAPALSFNRCSENKRCGIYYPERALITARGNVVKNNGAINFRWLRNMLWAKEFDELEEIARRLRTEKREFVTGTLQLNWFYYSLGTRWSGYVPSREEELFGILDAWIRSRPESVIPRIIKAKVYVSFAWHARGGKYASDVPEYAWGIFKEKLNKAWDVLKEAEQLEEKDPELYRVFLTAGMGLSKSSEEMYELFEKGISVGEWYYPLHLDMSVNLLPRWGGGKSELALFAAKSATSAGREEGDILYARIVGDVVRMFRNKGPEAFKDLGFSYERAKRGHAIILERYPEASYYRNTYCLLASIYKDKETARELFDKIGDNWDGSVWHKEEYFRTHQSWAYK